MDSEYVTLVEPIDDPASMSEQALKSVLEAILFAASEPISLKQFQAALSGLDARTLRKVLDTLRADYQEMERSFHLAEVANGYQICTRPQYSEWIQKFYTQQVRVTLSPPALETLAIVAYKQPVTRADVAAIRGVNSDSVLNSLIEKGLVSIAGRKAGRSLLFSTTDEFLQQFGLKDASELPSLDEIDELLSAPNERRIPSRTAPSCYGGAHSVMNYNAWFQCSEGCGETYPLTEIIYRCQNCDGLLEVQHDMETLKQRSATDWKSLFEKRYMRTQYPYGSGVWGKKELVCPNVEDANIISMYEGGTNLFWAERFGEQLGLSDLWIKQCGNSHTGSFKDLGMTVLVSMVKQIIAESGNIRAVMCASTGDTSASLAAYASAAGIPAIILLPKAKVTREQLIQPIAKWGIDALTGNGFRRLYGDCAKNSLIARTSISRIRLTLSESRGKKRLVSKLCSSSIGRFRIGLLFREATLATCLHSDSDF